MTPRPTVSVIIPYYNHGSFLHAAVQSALLAAADLTIEVLIVNDGSREPSAAGILRNAAALSSNVRVIAKPNGGLSSARNAGLDQARGEFIQFLDSDDVLYPGKLALQVRHLRGRPDLIGSITHYSLGDHWLANFDTSYDSIGRFPLTAHSFLFFWERGFSVPIHTALFRSEALAEQRFDTSVEGKEDWIFWATLLTKHPQGLGYLPILGAVYRMHDGGMTRSHDRMGASFLTAADVIESLWGHVFPNFRAASKAWYARYYAPRIIEERLAIVASPPPCSPGSRPPAHATANRVGPKGVPSPARRRLAARSAAKLRGTTIDIVIPVFNHFDHLGMCLESALAQDHVGRVVAVNDASTDERVHPYLDGLAAKNPRLRYVRNLVNLGISRSQDLGVRACEAPFIGFLDCDDYLEPDASAAMTAHMQAVEADYYFSDRTDVDVSGHALRVARYGGYDWMKPSGVIENDLVLGMVASHWKVIRKTLYQRLGGSSDEFSGIQDWVLALRACGVARFSYLPEALYNHRIHGNAVTSLQSTSQMWRSNVARRRHLLGTRSGSDPGRVVSRLSTYKQVALLVARIMRDRAPITFDDAGRELSVQEIDLLREFNGLFDRIRLGENAAAAMAGYVWDHRAIEMSSPSPEIK